MHERSNLELEEDNIVVIKNKYPVRGSVPQDNSFVRRCCPNGTYFLLAEYERNVDNSLLRTWYGGSQL